jgi:preprotein translocase subunit SecD
MGKQRFLLALILIVVLGSLWVINQIQPKLGLDLKGGSQLTIQVNTTEKVRTITPQVLEAVQKIVENRVNSSGVTESVVQTAGDNKLLIQLPGVQDPKEAEQRLEGVARLDFRTQKPDTATQLLIFQQLLTEAKIKEIAVRAEGDAQKIAAAKADVARQRESIASLFEKSNLSGEQLISASSSQLPNSEWSVNVRFNVQGADLFAQLTKQIAGKEQGLGIFLDDELISYPRVSIENAQTGITGGSASITGNFDAKNAKDLADKLQGGALPVPIEVAEVRTVGATLGQDSIRSSIAAGIGGLALVLVFMAVYYRLPGIIANVSLMIYALVTYALFLLFNVTLTLPGIAGFILSIGMAVDANVLIFERTREELRAGKTLYRAVESGFYRAFSSILDSNVTTVIACAALYALGSGLVKGFAVTLAMGVVVSMFTAITCSRTFLLFVLSIPSLRKPKFFCPKVEAVRQ